MFFPKIGYVQGMNFLAGFFLMLSGFQSFETWDFLVNFIKKRKNLYFGIYDQGFPVLNFLCYSTNKILQISNKKIFLHLKSMNFPIDLWVSKWFLSFFILALPLEYLLRIFDYLLFSDVFGMVVVALVIVNSMEKEILKREFEDIALLFNDDS